jgi:3-oxoacyl-[acyl-carrier-protein] synthase-3
VLGIGGYRPRRRVGNEEIGARIGVDSAWIRRRSGIASRHVAAVDETVLSMAAEAARKALAAAGVVPGQVDVVLLASISYLYQTPAAAPRVAHEIGAPGAAALDISAACSGFGYGLALADSMVRAGSARHVLVIGAERMTDIVDPRDPAAAFLFGDGAGAAVVGPAGARGIFPTVWGSDGALADLIAHPRSWLDLRDRPGTPWPTMLMQGTEVFRWALRELPAVVEAILKAAGLTPADLRGFVPHQANLRIIEGVAKAVELPPEVAIARDVTTTANTSAASIPLALERLVERGEVSGGDLVLLLGFGAGMTYSGQVVAVP